MTPAQFANNRAMLLFFGAGSGDLAGDLEVGGQCAAKMLADLRIDEPDARSRVQAFAAQCQALYLQSMKLDQRLKIETMGVNDDT